MGLGGILARGAEGGFKAAGDIADKRITATLDEKKAAALEKRQLNMMRLQNEFGKSEREAGQDFQSRESETDRKFRSGESSADRSFRSKEAGDERSFRAGEAKTERDFENTSTTDIEKQYKFLTTIYGEDKAKSLILQSKDITSKTDLERQKLYSKTYTDTLKVLGGDMGEITPEMKKEARDLASKISGYSIGEEQSNTGNTFDALSEKIKSVTNKQPMSDDGMMKSHASTRQNIPSGILAKGGAKQIRPELPQDISKWNVQTIQQNGKPSTVLITDNGTIELTPDEVEMYKQYSSTQTGKTARDAASWLKENFTGAKTIPKQGVFKDM